MPDNAGDFKNSGTKQTRKTMNKIPLIIEREFLSRVKKRTFIVVTLLGPLLIAVIFVAPVLIATMGNEDVKEIAVVDQTGNLNNAFEDRENMKFHYLNESMDRTTLNHLINDSSYAAVLYHSGDQFSYDNLVLSSKKQPSITVVETINSSLEKKIENQRLKEQGLRQSFLDSLEANVSVKTTLLTEEGDEKVSSSAVYTALGFIAAILIYFVIFAYGSMVMRGVIEEKTNRVVEIMISSVKPFQLMMGKTIGVALVFLLQLALWIVLSVILIFVAQTLLLPQDMMGNAEAISGNMMMSGQMEQMAQAGQQSSSQMQEIYLTIMNINWVRFIFTFIFFFLGGYLLYTSLFAAIGAAVDNETDTQQFMFPVTIPLILSIIVASSIIQNPDTPLAFWFSIIPLTSPIIMVIRVLFGVPLWELLLSMGLLVLTFLFTIWVAAKIYRVGILMYGKKPSYKDLWKWIRMS